VEEALGPLDGVNSATVRVAEKCVDVDYDPDVIERDQIFHSLQEAGYPATR
jgi:copper chaperone CopZ